MSIETVLKNHTAALNRFCDFCEKYGVVPAQFEGVLHPATSTTAVSESAPQVTEVAPQVTEVAPQVTEVAPQVSDEPNATAPVVAETVTPEEDSIEAGVWIPQEEEREEDSDVAEAPVVEEPATKVTVSDVADSMKKLLPNRNAIVAVLDQFGVGKVTELKAEDLPKAKQLFDQALADSQGA